MNTNTNTETATATATETATTTATETAQELKDGFARLEIMMAIRRESWMCRTPEYRANFFKK